MPKIKLIDWVKQRQFPAVYTQEGKYTTIKFPYNKNILKEIKGCEDARWNPDDKTWEFVSPEFSPRSAFIMGYLTLGKFPHSISKPLERFKLKPQDVKFTRNLKQHQDEDARLGLTRRTFFFAHEMGLGKTLTMIEIMEQIRFNLNVPINNFHLCNDEDLFWVIAPRAPIKSWISELNKWESKVQPKLISCSHSKIYSAIEQAEFPPICIVVDEASRIKNPNAKRTQYLIDDLLKHQLDYWGEWAFRYCLSGTPAPKDPADWWAPVEFLMPGFLQEKSPNHLRKNLAYIEMQQGAHGQYPKVTGWNENEVKRLYKRLKPIVAVRFKKNCLDIPEKIYEEIELEPTKDIMDNARLIIETSPRVITALQKLRQLSDGFQYNYDVNSKGDKFRIESTVIRCPKDEQLEDDLDSLLNEEIYRVVIYAAFQGSIDKIVNTCLTKGWGVIRVDGRGWQAFTPPEDNWALGPVEATLEQFQEKDLDAPIAFVGHPKSGGMGITLNKSELCIFYSNADSGEDRWQAEDRIHRIGTKGAIIRDYLHLPTDKQCLDKLKLKKDLQDVTLGDLEKAINLI